MSGWPRLVPLRIDDPHAVENNLSSAKASVAAFVNAANRR